MKIALIGLSNSGKSTLFNALTRLKVDTAPYATTVMEPNNGVVKVPDARIDRLTEMFKPKKTSPSTVHYVDYLGLTKGDMKQNKAVFELIKDSDALVHVVRAFEDDAVAHPMSKVAPLSDMATVDMELLFGDMELVDKRLESIEQSRKRGKKPPTDTEEKALKRCKNALESETALRELDFDAEETKSLRHLQFMSIKPMIVAINIAEDDIGSDKTTALIAEAEKKYSGMRGVAVMAMSAKVEMEIAELPAGDAVEFLKALGIDEPALNRLIRRSYEHIGLISFFTVGEDEVKAWSIRKGTEALYAAGKIHSDIQRGFIRAETIGYDDFIASGGSLSEARDKGLLRLEGKTYVVRDGDIINFRFNV